MIRKFREVVTAWAIAVNPTHEQQEIAEIRLHICNGDIADSNGETQPCEHLGDAVGIPYCKVCTCPLQGKVFTPRNLGGCPKGKWNV